VIYEFQENLIIVSGFSARKKLTYRSSCSGGKPIQTKVYCPFTSLLPLLGMRRGARRHAVRQRERERDEVQCEI
jgi:hypothetical protein